MNGNSLSLHTKKLNQLKQILPEAFTEGKIDWGKLQATLGEDINFANERYVLNWAEKGDAFRTMQQPSTRKRLSLQKRSRCNLMKPKIFLLRAKTWRRLKYYKKVMTLDRIFCENDQLKTDTALQLKDVGVEFKTI